MKTDYIVRCECHDDFMQVVFDAIKAGFLFDADRTTYTVYFTGGF